MTGGTSSVGLNVKVANLRTTWSCLLDTFLRRGLMTVEEIKDIEEIEEIEEIRRRCIDVAEEFGASGGEAQRVFGAECTRDLDVMFSPFLTGPSVEH